MQAKTTAELVKLLTRVMQAMAWEKLEVKKEDHPEGEDLPSAEVGGFMVWQSLNGRWLVDVGITRGGSYYEPPDFDASNLFEGPHLWNAIEKVVECMARERLAGLGESLAWEEAAFGAEGQVRGG